MCQLFLEHSTGVREVRTLDYSTILWKLFLKALHVLKIYWMIRSDNFIFLNARKFEKSSAKYYMGRFDLILEVPSCPVSKRPNDGRIPRLPLLACE